MKHKILGIAVLLCAVFLAACSDLVDELTPKETYYRMEIPSDIENGKVSADKTSARAGDTVRLTLSANEGYKLNGQPTVKDADGANVPVREITPGEVYEFTMPKSAVKVSAVFSPIPTSVTVTISESTGDFSLESSADGTKLTFTAVGTDSGANLVWKVYKGDTALADAAYKQSGPDTAFSFDTGSLEGSYTLLVTSGTRSAAAVFTVNTTVTYTVKHLFEKVDGSGYEQNSDYSDETRAGTVGSQTEAIEKTVTGFTAQSVTQKTIAADGSTVVEIMYNRNLHTVTYEDGADDGDIAVPEDGTLYRYGQAVTVSFTGIGERAGYIFNSWSDGSTSYTSDGTKSFTMGDSPVTLTAQWTKIGTTFAVTISESTGDFSLESSADGTKLTFTAVGTDSGANLVWKVYKGDTALADAAYTQNGPDKAFSFDTGSLEAGSYTLFVTSGTRSATAVFTVPEPVTVTLKTGGDINSILVSLCKDGDGYPVCTKFARSNTNSDEATLYLDTEGKYIPVWLKGTEVYYYVPDGCTPVMNEDSSGMFLFCTKLTSLDLTGFDTSNVTNMSAMFYGCEGLTSLDLSKFDTSNVKNMSAMFAGCSGLTSLDLSKFVTSNVTNMSAMFFGCSKLTSLDLSKFVTSKVTDMSGMFFDCYGLTSLDVSKFVTSNVTNMSEMFLFCTKLTSLDVKGFDTSNVTNMSEMFKHCSGLTSLDLSKFDTGNVTNMESMFEGCSGLTSLVVTGFNTSKVKNMLFMFSGCSGLTSLDLSKFDTGNVMDMYGMFEGCSGLTSLDVSKFVTSNVTNMSRMFASCSGLTGLDVSKFVTSKVENMSGMFEGCSGLTSLDVSKFDTINVTGMSFMFSGCEGLTSLDLSKFDTTKVTDMSSMFSGCKELMTIYATDKFVTTSVSDGDDCFNQCSNLKGGAGTTYDENNIYATYARIDGGTDAPGYFTAKATTIGTKSEPDAVGDIVFSDGSATPYTSELTEEQKSKAVAVIYYAGSAEDVLGAKMLGVGLKNTGTDSTLAWAKDGVNGCGTNITAIQCTPIGNEAATATFSDDLDGSDNWQALCDAVSDEDTSGNYPAWEWVNAYATTANLKGDYASGWYLSTVAELCMLYREKDTVNSALEKAGGMKIADAGYWSSSQVASDANVGRAWYVLFDGGYLITTLKKASKSVCTVRAF